MTNINSMRIVQIHQNIKINSSPYKIKKALEKKGIIPKILTMNSFVDDIDVITIKKNIIYKIYSKIERIKNENEYKKRYKIIQGYPFSYFETGIRIDKEKLVKDADIIILHWVCGGYISPYVIKKLCLLNKNIIWVCHDSWPFTGGCHVKMGCESFKSGCGYCPMLQSKIEKDWSYRLLRKKKASIDRGLFTIVSPSNWMDINVKESYLFSDCRHEVIPNPININKYIKRDRKELRKQYNINQDKTIILFGAVNATSTPYKGYHKLLETLKIFSETVNNKDEYEIAVFGASSGENDNIIPFEINYLGRLSEEQMIEAYSLSDVYVTTTLDDNLPNTVMESLACELPVVSFDTGGVSDMLIHKKNGYLAKYNDSSDFAEGIKWVLDHNDNNVLGKYGRLYICDNFSESIVADKYIELFNKVLDNKSVN